jgi:NADPH2:quinone reductase
VKAAYIEETGPPQAIRYGELEPPRIGEQQVLVRVSAVSVNPIDTYIRSGSYAIKLPRPFIIGRDLTGRVEAVGAAVTRFAAGARVWCNNQGYSGRQGTFAEFAAIDEDLLYPLPENADELETVAVVHSALTACLGLLDHARLRRGESLFINGGSGNVGSATLQLAHYLGARVIVTAGSEEKLARCLRLGADRAVDYRTADIAAEVRAFAPAGIDVYWDTTRQPDFERAVPLLAQGGRIVLMAGLAAHPTFPVGAFYTRDCSMHGFAVTNARKEQLRSSAELINKLLAEGRLHGRIDRVMPLAEAARAHHLTESPAAQLDGKIVLVP